MTTEVKSTPAPMASIGRIYGAIIAAKREVGAVGKHGKVTEYGKYDYRKFDDVLDAVVPLLNEYGLLIVATVLGREERQDAKKHFVTMTMGYRLFAEDGSFIEGSQVGEAFDVGDKAATKAQTVALRIFLCTTFNIPYNEMRDPESGDQHQFSAVKSTVTVYGRLCNKLDTLKDGSILNGLVTTAIHCFRGTQENGDRLTADEMRRSREEFSASARRLGCTEGVVKALIERIDAALNGTALAPEAHEVVTAVEPVRAREVEYLFGVADDRDKTERAVLTMLQSYWSAAITQAEMDALVAKHCPEDDSNGVACFHMGQVHCADTAAQLSGVVAAIQQAKMSNQIGVNVANAMSQYAQNRFERMGGDSDGS